MPRKFAWLLFVTFLAGAFLRFYKLDWGEGFYSHPDEYHIVAAADRLSFPSRMNPHLFSYGSFTVYLIYFTKLIFGPLLPAVAETSSFLIGRFYSALFSSLTVLLVFLISKRISKRTVLVKDCSSAALLAALLAAFAPGLVQQAHFTTPESVLIFWLFLTLWLLILYVEKGKFFYFYLAAASLGVGLGTKTAAATFLLPFALAPFLNLLRITRQYGDGMTNFSARGGSASGGSSLSNSLSDNRLKSVTPMILLLLSGLAVVGLFFFLAFPYAFLDFSSFRGTWNYETALARGFTPVFYMRQFINTTPLLFQLQEVFPFALGPALLVSGIFGLATAVFLLTRRVFDFLHRPKLILFVVAFFSYLLPNIFLFAKWTRFSAPSFPFFAIFAALFFLHLLHLEGESSTPSRWAESFIKLTTALFVTVQLFWCLTFFSIYLRPDVRWQADDWIQKNLPQGSKVLVEGGNMVDLPLTGSYPRVSLDFYGLEESREGRQRLFRELERADYFFVQSRRVFANHLRLPEKYPFLSRFYNFLFYEKLGFREVGEFTSYPQLKVGRWKVEFPDELAAEETWSVFDHPVVRIFKKVQPLTEESYKEILGVYSPPE